ncbi:MAG: TonB-dependent receptor [Pseudomonadota bacterium]
MKHTLSNASNHVTQINFRKKIAATAIATVLSTSLAFANADMQVDVSVPAGSLSKAIVSIAQQYDVTIVAPDALILGLNTTEFADKISLDALFQRLLDGTDLSIVQLDEKIYKVQKTGTDSSTSTDGKNDSVLAENVEIIEVIGEFQQSLVDRLPIKPQELPFTLDTIGRDDIDIRGFIRPIDVLDTFPNVQISIDTLGSGTPLFLVRGFEAPVLIDNRLVEARDLAQPDSSFVERYEVLKGPASIALGPVSGGGVINAVTKSPRDFTFTTLNVSGDQFGTFIAELDWNVAEALGNDALDFRLSGGYRDFEFDPEEQDRKEFALRPVIVFDIGSDTIVKTSVGYKNTDIKPNVGFPLYSDGSVPEEFDTDTFFGLASAYIEVEDIGFDAQLTHSFLDNLRLVARGAVQSTDLNAVDRNGLYNYTYNDGGPGASRSNPVGYSYSQTNNIDRDNEFFDVQLLYSLDLLGQESNIVVGGSYRTSETASDQSFYGAIGPFAFSNIDEPRFGVIGQIDPAFVRDQVFTEDLWSLYSEFALRTNSWLSVVGGVRYDDFENSNINFADNDPVLSTSEETATTYRLGASARITSSITGFISYAEAFVPQSRIRSNNEAVGPELLTNYEIGLKGNISNGLVVFSASVFQTDRTNVAVDDPAFIDGFFRPFAVTIDAQRNEGFEITSELTLFDGLTISANYGYIKQRLLENTENVFFVPFPENQASVFSDYTIQTGFLKGLRLGGGVRYFSSRISEVETFDFPSVTLFDGFLGFDINETTSIQLNVLNLTDEQYLETGGTTDGSLGGQQQFGTPMTFRLSLRAEF